MIELLLAGGVGALLGAGTTAVVTSRRREAAEPALSESDREQVTEEFRVHTSAMSAQVSSFADELAGDDEQLRERLRQFEWGR